MKIISIGEITVDNYYKQDQTFVGGISLNFAVNAKRCGAETVSLVSCVGTDSGGQLVLETLAKEQVDYSHVAMIEGETAVCGIEVYENGERVFPEGTYHLNVLDQLRLTNEIADFILQHDILVTLFYSVWPQDMTTQLMMLTEGKLKRVMDFGDWSDGNFKEVALPFIESIDLAFLSGDEQTIEQIRPIAARVEGLIVVTLGSGGSCAIQKGRMWRQTAVSVLKVVDTTGCGDGFQAAFTVNYFRHGDIKQALEAGAKHASKIINHYGAFTQ
ncbi:MAG: PfkB family carbohydrate kinase [Chloroflexota bacterium]